MGKGFLEMIRDAPQIDYDPNKGITMDELQDWFIDLSKVKLPKPEYILSKNEAETLPLHLLNWLGENYKVLCSLEVSNIVKQREAAAPLV